MTETQTELRLERTYTIQQMATWLQVSVTTIRRRIAAGDFPPPLRIGHQYRWTASGIQTWVDAQEQLTCEEAR